MSAVGAGRPEGKEIMLDIKPVATSDNSSPSAGPCAPLSDLDDPHADLEHLGNAIAELSAHIQAATYRLLVLICEFDQRHGWNTGFRSCAHWLNWRTGLDLGAAREKVRVAHALADLPAISRALQQGNLSYSKVRALTRVATPGNEAELLEFALSGTAAHVETLVRAWRRVDRYAAMEEGQRIIEHRRLSTFTDDDGMLVIRARLAPEVGALFQKALDAAMEGLFQRSQDDETSAWSGTPVEQRRADALELLVESALEGDLDPGTVGDRYQVVVHVSAETSDEPATRSAGDAPDSFGRSPGRTTSPHGVGELDTGENVSAETSRRLACEASRVVMNHAPDGTVLDVGRKTRAIHPAMRRALTHRDGGCRFPGCSVKHCDAHHVEHWADGGETKLDNLLLLCRFHHRALHEGGFRVVLEPDGTSRFYTARGVPIPEAPRAPTVAAQPAVELSRHNWRAGLAIDAFTGFPTWEGGPANYNYALEGLRRDWCHPRSNGR